MRIEMNQSALTSFNLYSIETQITGDQVLHSQQEVPRTPDPAPMLPSF